MPRVPDDERQRWKEPDGSVESEVIITFQATNAMKDELDTFAEANRISRSELIRRAIRYLFAVLKGDNTNG